MLFNELRDLIYHAPSEILIDEFLKLIDNKTECVLESDKDVILETNLLTHLTYYIQTKNELMKHDFIKSTGLSIGQFTIINQFYNNTFDVCHSLNIYKYLMVIYFLDDNSTITFFNIHTFYPSKGDIVIFPIAWFFIYKILKKNENQNNIYIFNNVLKAY
ncbi:MAG: hypothetical protein ACOVRN_15835 [Flavobacterium sp.]